MSADGLPGDSYTYAGSDGITEQTVREGDLVNVYELGTGPRPIVYHGIVDCFTKDGAYVEAHHYRFATHGLELVVEQPYRIDTPVPLDELRAAAADRIAGRMSDELAQQVGRAFLDAAAAGRLTSRIREVAAYLLLAALAAALIIVVAGGAYWYLSTINEWADHS